MAYDRSDIGKRIEQIEQELMVDGNEPSVGDVVDAVAEAGICGRGVAQQVLAELRKSRKANAANAPTVSDNDEFPESVDKLVGQFDEIHLVIDKVKHAVGLRAAANIEEINATFSAIIADQGLAHQRAEEQARGRIEMLETSLAQSQTAEAETRARLQKSEIERADLFARTVEAEEALAAIRTRVTLLETERDQCKDSAELLRADLDAHRRDLAAARQAETALRDELRMAADDRIDRVEYATLKSQADAQGAALADEKARNAELHKQLLRIMSTIVHPMVDSTSASDPPS